MTDHTIDPAAVDPAIKIAIDQAADEVQSVADWLAAQPVHPDDPALRLVSTTGLPAAFRILEGPPPVDELLDLDTWIASFPEYEPPPPPPPVGLAPILHRDLNTPVVIWFWQAFPSSSAYIRQDYSTVLYGPTTELRLDGRGDVPQGTISVYIDDMPTEIGGTGTRTLLWQGTMAAARVNIPLDVSGYADGDYFLDIESDHVDETGALHPVVIRNTIAPLVQTYIPVKSSSYDVSKHPTKRFFWSWIPATFDPVLVPRQPRVAAHSPGVVPSPANMTLEWLTKPPAYPHDRIPYLALLDDGETYLTSASRHPYHYYNTRRQHDFQASFDGPRGFARCNMPTWGRVGFDGRFWGSDARRLFKVHADGSEETLIGEVQSQPLYWEQVEDSRMDAFREIKGDWSGVSGPHYLNKVWNCKFIEDTLALDPTFFPDPAQPTTPGHIQNPALLIFDTINNRVLKATANRNDANAPMVVTDFILNIDDPWGGDIDEDDGIVYVSSRTNDVIRKYNLADGAYLGVFVEASAPGTYGYIDGDRIARLTATIEDARAEPCVLPENVRVASAVPGGEKYVWWSALVTKQIRRAPKSNPSAWEVVPTGRVDDEIFIDANSKFTTFQVVEDDRFFPHGTLIVPTWASSLYGWPEVITPPGHPDFLISSSGEHPIQGPANAVDNQGYSCLGIIGLGLTQTSPDANDPAMMYVSGSGGGVARITMRQPGDLVVDPVKYEAGRVKYREFGAELVWGTGFWPSHQLPLDPILANDPDVQHYIEVQHDAG